MRGVKAQLVDRMFTNLRSLLITATRCRKPTDKELGEILKPLQLDIGEITKAKETNRKDREWFNHLSVVAEGAPSVGWVTVVSSAALATVIFCLYTPVSDQTRAICQGNC